MTEIWLKSNRRVLLLALLPVAVLAVTGMVLLGQDTSQLFRWIAYGLLLLSAVLAVGILQQWARPRLAYRDGEMLFYLQARQPIAVPVEVVEAFFVGQTPVKLPGPDLGHTESVNLIARLSQKYPEWAQRDVKHALGSWCDGYVTIRGTWCEELDEQVVRRINKRLAEVSRARREAFEGTQP